MRYIFYIIVILLLLNIVNSQPTGKVTVYFKICKFDNLTEDKTCDSWDLGKGTYYINPYTQQVMSDGWGLGEPDIYQGCTIASMQLWACDATPKLLEDQYKFQDKFSYNYGKFTENTFFSRIRTVIYISHTDYLWEEAILKLKNLTSLTS